MTKLTRMLNDFVGNASSFKCTEVSPSEDFEGFVKTALYDLLDFCHHARGDICSINEMIDEALERDSIQVAQGIEAQQLYNELLKEYHACDEAWSTGLRIVEKLDGNTLTGEALWDEAFKWTVEGLHRYGRVLSHLAKLLHLLIDIDRGVK